MGLGDKIDAVGEKLAVSAHKFLPDLCSLIVPVSTPDGFGGQTTVNTEIATDVPCSYKLLSTPRDQVVSGGVVTTMSHRLTLPSTEETRAIEPNYKIVVTARDLKASVTFEQPTILNQSLMPFVKVAAQLRGL